MAKSPLEEMLDRELKVDREQLNAHMQAITNGYSIATTLISKVIETSKSYDLDKLATELNTLAGKVGSSIYRDYLVVLKESENAKKT